MSQTPPQQEQTPYQLNTPQITSAQASRHGSSPDEALALYQAYLAAIVESSDDAIFGKDLDGIITSWNPSAERLYGYKAQEIIGKSVAIIFPPELQGDLETIMRRLKAGQKIDHYQTTRIRKDGRRLKVSVTISPIKDASGTIIGATAITRDITSQKRAEERVQFLKEVSKLLASTFEYSTTLSNIAHLIVPHLADWFTVDLADQQGNIELAEVAHIDPAKVQWARAVRTNYPIDSHSLNGVAQVIRTGQAILATTITDEELASVTRSNEELMLLRQLAITSAMIVPLVARGKTIGAITFVSTESKRQYDQEDLALAEEIGRYSGVALDNVRLYQQVRESRDQLQVILQGVADGITVQDARGAVIYANEAAAQMSGFTSAEAMLADCPELMGSLSMKDESGKTFAFERLPGRRALQGEKNVQELVQYTHRVTGQVRWSLIKAEPIFDERGRVQFAVNVITDMTERQELEQRKDEFIEMASHELKTPVTSLKGFTNVLQRRLAKRGSEEELYLLAKMDAQLDRLTKLVSDLLDISRMQTSKLNYQEEIFDLSNLVRDVIETMQTTIHTHTLQLEEEEEHLEIFGDKDRIAQVIINLLNNAIKYSARADKVCVRVTRNQGQAVVSVQDFGIGIAENHHAKIFRRFYQVTDREEKTYPGLGIGLYICHQIVERHHGTLRVESKKGAGATFFVNLPLAVHSEDKSVEITKEGEKENYAE